MHAIALCLLLGTAVPVLKGAPKLDGNWSDWRGALELPPVSGTSSMLRARVGVVGTSLFVGVDVEDDTVGPGDLLDVALFFPGSGAASRGFVYRMGFDGVRMFDEETAAPAFAQHLMRAEVQRRPRGVMIEAMFPARALPSFPAKGPLGLELCLTYQDKDDVGAPPKLVQSCSGGSMEKASLQLPDSVRSSLKIKSPPNVLALEGRPGGWIGFGSRHEIVWVRADEPLTENSLGLLVADSPLAPESIGMAPPHLVLVPAGRKPIFSVLSGKDPQPGDAPCDQTKEVRLSLFLVEGRTALQVLECPAVTCTLGRATSVVLEEDGSLSVGYSSGLIATYSWSTDHFERTQYGMLP